MWRVVADKCSGAEETTAISSYGKKKVNFSLYRPWRPFGLREVEAPTFLDIRLATLHAGRFLPPRRFLVLISVRGWVDPRTIVQLEGVGKLKQSTSSGTLTGDLLACKHSASTNYATACTLPHTVFKQLQKYFSWKPIFTINICMACLVPSIDGIDTLID
jgi:hypothetical protein